MRGKRVQRDSIFLALTILCFKDIRERHGRLLSLFIFYPLIKILLLLKAEFRVSLAAISYPIIEETSSHIRAYGNGR